MSKKLPEAEYAESWPHRDPDAYRHGELDDEILHDYFWYELKNTLRDAAARLEELNREQRTGDEAADSERD